MLVFDLEGAGDFCHWEPALFFLEPVRNYQPPPCPPKTRHADLVAFEFEKAGPFWDFFEVFGVADLAGDGHVVE